MRKRSSIRRCRALLLALALMTGCAHVQRIASSTDADPDGAFAIAALDVRRINDTALGHVVQIRLRDGQVLKSKEMTVTRTSLLWRDDSGAQQILELSKVAELRVLKRSAGRGIGLGMLAGVLVGATIGYASGSDQCPPDSFCLFQLTAGDKALFGAMAFGLTGAVLGGLSGASDVESFKIGPRGNVGSGP
jgi:hypothetical protein